MTCIVEAKDHRFSIFEADRIQIFRQQVNFNNILVIYLLQNVEIIGDILEQRICFSYVDVSKVEIHFFLAL